MKLSNDELIQEFYEKVKDQYPDITVEELKEICHSPWRYMKYTMENGSLDSFRMKYFGIFQVRIKRAEMMLKNLKTRFEANKIDHKEYFRYKEMIEKYLEKNGEIE